MYTYIHTYVHTHIHTYTYRHIYIYIYINTYIHIHTYTYLYTHIYIYTYIHINTHIYIHMYIYISFGKIVYVYERSFWLISTTRFATSVSILSSAGMLYFFDSEPLQQMIDVRRRLKRICCLTHVLVSL